MAIHLVLRRDLNYKLVGFIAQGGFGTVEKVEDETGIMYARKKFAPTIPTSPEEIDKLRKRFIREVKYQRSLPDDFTIPVIDADLDASEPWFIMPLAEKTYEQQIADDRDAGQISSDPLADVLNALGELHELGFVHRDLKPQNILLHQGKWKLADFGLVLPPAGTTTKLTSFDSAWGTPMYSAPEQATSFGKVTLAADIYSFGCILHDLLTDGIRVPYAKLTAGGPLGLIVEKCTETQAAKRFHSIRALRGALLSELAEPIHLVPSAQAQEWMVSIQVVHEWSAHQVSDFAKYLETEQDQTALWEIFTELDEAFWDGLFAVDPEHAESIAQAYCDWTNRSFGFAYCDVLVLRLESIFALGSIAVKAAVAVATARLACSHNRWFVMRRLRAMCGPSLDDVVAKRIAIEIRANEAADEFEACCDANSPEDCYHPAIVAVISGES